MRQMCIYYLAAAGCMASIGLRPFEVNAHSIDLGISNYTFIVPGAGAFAGVRCLLGSEEDHLARLCWGCRLGGTFLWSYM